MNWLLKQCVLWCTIMVSLVAGAMTGPALAAKSVDVDTGKVTASLVSSHDQVEAGQTFQIALRTVLDDHWHTYWRNPGDSGEPVQIDWKLPEGVSLMGDLYWPLPRTIATGPIINYGFEGTPLFVQDFTLSDTIAPGTALDIEAHVYYLVCKDVCIPEDGKLTLSLVAGEPITDGLWESAIQTAIADSPSPGRIEGQIDRVGDQLTLTFANIPEGIDVSESYFFPHDQGLLMHSATQERDIQNGDLILRVPADYLWDSDISGPFEGVLGLRQDGQRRGVIVSATVGENSPVAVAVETHSVEDVKPSVTDSLSASTEGISTNLSDITLWSALIGALIGGLILNLMPCVFPVISIKALSIANSAHGERSQVRREAWLYMAGVIATFMALTLLLLGLKAGGAELGWGFQLQSPKVVGLLALLLFLIGLNLMGVFDIGTRLQNTGAGLVQTSKASGSFFTGALAVIVATPCTAPFMAGAIGYAMAQPAPVTIVVFMALAIGFALPFLLIAYVPGLMSRLPKPGPWMVRFREFLAFPMFAAAIWLVWVLSIQIGETGVLAVLSAMLAFTLAIWLFKRQAGVAKALGALSALMALIIPLSLNIPSSTPYAATPSVSADAAFNNSWSLERITELRSEGYTVFVDFTAAWCVTCQANKKLVLDTPDVKQLFGDTDTIMLIADWTNKNDEIAQELARHGRSGVPLYLLYPPGQLSVKPAILPQILTKSVLEEAIVGARS